MDSELIRLKEASKNIGLSTSTLRKMIKRNELKGVKIGGNYYVRPNDYYEFVYNIECKKIGVKPDLLKKYIEEEKSQKYNDLFENLSLDDNSQNMMKALMFYLK